MQLPVGANEAELEERIIQHLAAAAAMGQAHHIARREGPRNRSSGQARPQFLVFSANRNAPSTGPFSSSSPTQREGEPAPEVTIDTPSSPARTVGEESSPSITPIPSAEADQRSTLASGSSVLLVDDQGNSLNNMYLLFSNSIVLIRTLFSALLYVNRNNILYIVLLLEVSQSIS